MFVTGVSWRDDLRCGTKYPIANGDPAQCDPNNAKGLACCSSGGWCGKTSAHCKCDGCIDYKPKTDTTKKGTSNATAISKCKVKCTACPGYIYAKRNVKQCSQCGGSVHLKCWKDRLWCKACCEELIPGYNSYHHELYDISVKNCAIFNANIPSERGHVHWIPSTAKAPPCHPG